MISDTLINQFYNKEIKLDYLESNIANKKTQETYAVSLVQIAKYEEFIGKDLYDFNENDIINFFARQATKIDSYPVIKGLFSKCAKYIEWAMDKDYKRIGTNPLDKIDLKKDILPMFHIKKEKYLSEEQVWKVANEAKNYQDSCPLVCAFYGVRGDKNIELINLKKDDIDVVTNKVRLATEINEDRNEIKSTRIIELSKQVIELMLKAWEETEYYKSGDESRMKKEYDSLVESDYVLKPAKIGKRNNEGKVGTATIADRVKSLLLNAGYKDSSINTICTGGRLHLLKQMEKNNGKIELDDYKKVNELFGKSSKHYDNLKTLYESWRPNEINSMDNVKLIDYIDERELNNIQNLYEGGEKQIGRTVFQRSVKARAICIKRWGANCYICGFNFKDVYGEIGENLIHVHHLKQLSDNRDLHKVHPIEDLRPVCPNCHLILHKKNPPFTIEKVKEMIESNK